MLGLGWVGDNKRTDDSVGVVDRGGMPQVAGKADQVGVGCGWVGGCILGVRMCGFGRSEAVSCRMCRADGH